MKMIILAEDLVKFMEEMKEEIPKELSKIEGTKDDMIEVEITFKQVTKKLIEDNL